MVFRTTSRHPSCWLIRQALGWALVAAALLLPAVADALRWHWSNPLPHGNNITDFVHRTNGYYAQVTDHGQLYTSSDRIRWEAQETGTRKALRGAAFLGERLIVSGEAGLILWADDPQIIHRLELGTDDWLESVATSTNRAVAVGDNGAIYTSDDGTNWLHRAVDFSTSLRGVAWGGGKFVAVGEGGKIYTSPDGVEWSVRAVTDNTGANLNRVAWTGNGFVVAGDASGSRLPTIILGSAAGTSWNLVDFRTSGEDLLAATASPKNQLVVGDAEVRFDSGSLLPWLNEAADGVAGKPPPAVYLSALWDGARFLLGGRTGQTVAGEPSASPDNPFVWSDYPTVTRQWLFDLTTTTAVATNLTPVLEAESTGTNPVVTYLANQVTNNFFIAAGDRARLLQSDNGVNWAGALAPTNAANRIYLGVGGNDRGLVAVGNRGTLSFSPVDYVPLVTTNFFPLPSTRLVTNGEVVVEEPITVSVPVIFTNLVNTLGLAWYGIVPPTANDIQAVCATADQYVIAGSGGFLAASPDGTNWTARTSGTGNFLTGLTAWPGGFVAVGDAGTILTSPDAATWTPRQSGTANWLYRVRAANGLLVAVGEGGTILTSSDAIEWTPRRSGIESVTNWLNNVTFAAGAWYAVGNQGTLLTSTNAVDWQRDTDLITGKSLYGVAALENRLVTVGIEGVILRTVIAPFAEPVTIADFPRNPGQQLFLFNGELDQRFRLDRATTLPNWQPGIELEITDPTGALLFFDATLNDPQAQYFSAPSVP